MLICHGSRTKYRSVRLASAAGLNQPLCVFIAAPPDPPVKLELRNLQSNDVTLCWKSPATDDAASRMNYYVIYIRPSDKPDDWTKIAKVKNSINQHLVQLLESDKRYVLGVASRNKGGDSSIIETRPFILEKQTSNYSEVMHFFEPHTPFSLDPLVYLNL